MTGICNRMCLCSPLRAYNDKSLSLLVTRHFAKTTFHLMALSSKEARQEALLLRATALALRWSGLFNDGK